MIHQKPPRLGAGLGAALVRAQEMAEATDHGAYDTAWPAVQALALLSIAHDLNALRRAFDAVTLQGIHPDDARRIFVTEDARDDRA